MLVLQVLAQDRRMRLHYNNQLRRIELPRSQDLASVLLLRTTERYKHKKNNLMEYSQHDTVKQKDATKDAENADAADKTSFERADDVYVSVKSLG